MNSLALILIILGLFLIILNYKDTRKYVDQLININRNKHSKIEHIKDIKDNKVIGINLSNSNLQITDINNLS